MIVVTISPCQTITNIHILQKMSLKRRLSALGHPNPSKVDPQNDNQFRDLVLWLEDQKIRWLTKIPRRFNENSNLLCRHYSIDDRSSLRDTKSQDWPQIYNKYLKDLACPMVKRFQFVPTQTLMERNISDFWQPDGSSPLAAWLCDKIWIRWILKPPPHDMIMISPICRRGSWKIQQPGQQTHWAVLRAADGDVQ